MYSGANPVEVVSLLDNQSEGWTEPEKTEKASLVRQWISDDPAVIGIWPVYYDPELKIRMVSTGNIIVKMSDGASLATIIKITGFGLVRQMKLKNTCLLKCDGDALAGANWIHSLEGVEWAEPDFIGEPEPTRIPDDPWFDRAWHLNDDDRGLSAYLAWDIGWGDEDVVVAVYDDGIERDHPDLNISPEGKNWLYDPPRDDPWPPQSSAAHGTSCAGIIGAVGDNDLGVIGVAPGVTVMPMRITNYPDGGFASSSNQGDAILYAAERGHVGTVSIIGMRSSYLEDAIEEAALKGRGGKGFLFFTSSGNGGNGELTYPSLFKYSISVGASTSSDRKASYSQWGETGKTVEFLAPSGVPTTDLVGSRGWSNGDYNSSFGGTSAATPVAAGVAALILSTNPDLTRDQVLDVMRSTCDKIGGVDYGSDGIHPMYGYGRLNAFRALQKLPPYIAEHPKDTSVVLDEPAHFTAAVRGYEVEYQWQKLSADGKDWENIPYATELIYIVTGTAASDIGSYRLTAVNDNGSDTSETARLEVTGVVAADYARRDLPGTPEVEKVSDGSGRHAFMLSVPSAGPVRFECTSPDGRTKTILDQHLVPGRYRVAYPCKIVKSGVYLYRLYADHKVCSGRFVVAR